jgi:glyoxylase-like metal-dependent hydrolase (beta-lactamase superfamily II)
MEAGVLTLLDGEAQITQYIRVVPTPGHTAGHQSVIITPPAGAPYFVLGDLATYMIQFSRLPWVTAYDVLPLVTIESKRQWQVWAVETGATLISPHETLMPSGTLIRTDKGFLNVVAARPS